MYCGPVKKAAEYYEPKNAIGDEVRFPPKETLRTGPAIGPEPEVSRPATATELLEDLFKSIESLEMETAALIHQIDFVLTEDSPQIEPVPGPRVSTSVITYRIAHAADLIDEMARRVNNIRRRITL